MKILRERPPKPYTELIVPDLSDLTIVTHYPGGATFHHSASHLFLFPMQLVNFCLDREYIRGLSTYHRKTANGSTCESPIGHRHEDASARRLGER